MADVSYTAAFELDFKDLKTGVVATEKAIRRIGTAAQETDKQTETFTGSFAKEFTKSAVSVQEAGKKMAKGLAGAFGPIGLAMMAITAAIGAIKKAIEKYVTDIKDAKKASADYVEINKTLGTSYETNEKQLRNLSQTQKDFIQQMLGIVKVQKDLDRQLRLGLITYKDYAEAQKTNNANAMLANAEAIESAKTQYDLNERKIKQIEKEIKFNTAGGSAARKYIDKLEKEQTGLLKTIEDSTKALEANKEAYESLGEESDSEKETRLWREKLDITHQTTLALEKQAELEKQTGKGENANARLNIYQQELDALAAKKVALQDERN